jgi:hypothetical protein
MRGVISKSGDKTSLAEENEQYGETYLGTKTKVGDRQGGPET